MSYTHTFKIKTDGVTIEGDVEFNLDGVASYTTDDPMELTLPQADRVNALFSEVKRLFDAFGGLEKLKINRIE